MDKVCLLDSGDRCRVLTKPFILSLDARVSKEMVDGLQRVDIALSKYRDTGALKDASVPRYTVTNLHKEYDGNLCLDRIEIEVYEMDSVSDAIMRVSENVCFRERDTRKVDLALGTPYTHSLWVHSKKPLYALVKAKLFVVHGDGNNLSIPLELCKVCAGDYGEVDIRKGE
jgi:hypothetical protein